MKIKAFCAYYLKKNYYSLNDIFVLLLDRNCTILMWYSQTPLIRPPLIRFSRYPTVFQEDGGRRINGVWLYCINQVGFCHILAGIIVLHIKMSTMHCLDCIHALFSIIIIYFSLPFSFRVPWLHEVGGVMKYICLVHWRKA